MTRQAPERSSFAIWFAAAWAALALGRLLLHEMWRDELQAWTIAASSDSLGQLVANMRYEGTPGLWAFCLFVMSRVSQSPIAMQVLNLAIGTGTVYLLVRYAPFSRLLSVALALGYFVAYEYGTISRSYGLGLFLIVLFCAVFTSTGRMRLRLMAAILAALALTSVYGAIAAAALAAGALVDEWKRHPVWHAWTRLRTAGLVVIVSAGILGAALFARQPSDTGFPVTMRLAVTGDSLAVTAASLWSGFVPVPPLKTAFWNQNALDRLPIVKGAAGLLVFAVALFSLRRHNAALALFAVGSIGLLLFTYTIYFGGVRHHGHYFLIFLAASWLAYASRQGPDRLLQLVTFGLAGIHLAAGLFAGAMDVRLPFSGSRAAADFIRAHYPADIPVVVDPELPGVGVGAWLERPVYMVQSDRWGRFVIWNNQRQPSELDRAVASADRLSTELARDVLLVVTYRSAPPERFRPVGRFPGALVPEETYNIYLRAYDGRAQ